MEYATRAIPAAVKRAVIARDGMICHHCGTPVVRSAEHRDDRLHFDHLKHWALGGDHSPANLVVSCARCNLTRRNPRRSLRPAGAAEWLRWTNGRRAWWPDGYSPPWIMPNDNPGMYLMDYVDRGRGRRSLDSVIQQITSGQLAASGPGEPIAVAWMPSQTGRRRRR